MAVLVHVKPGQGAGILPVKAGTTVYSNLNAIRNLHGINTFSLRNFPNVDYIPDVKEDVRTWFRSMRGVRHTHLDGYINEFNWRHWIARQDQVFDSFLSAVSLIYNF